MTSGESYRASIGRLLRIRRPWGLFNCWPQPCNCHKMERTNFLCSVYVCWEFLCKKDLACWKSSFHHGSNYKQSASYLIIYILFHSWMRQVESRFKFTNNLNSHWSNLLINIFNKPKATKVLVRNPKNKSFKRDGIKAERKFLHDELKRKLKL